MELDSHKRTLDVNGKHLLWNFGPLWSVKDGIVDGSAKELKRDDSFAAAYKLIRDAMRGHVEKFSVK